MALHIIAVGTRMPDWVDRAFEDYARRMPPEWRIQLHEVRPEPRQGSRTSAQVMGIEAERIRTQLPRGIRRVMLDERGRDLTTVQLAEHMQRWQQEGADTAFVIGGADGLDPTLKQEADLLLRLSSLTLPHGMVRVLLAEQLYRGWSILAHHPYHRV